MSAAVTRNMYASNESQLLPTIELAGFIGIYLLISLPLVIPLSLLDRFPVMRRSMIILLFVGIGLAGYKSITDIVWASLYGEELQVFIYSVLGGAVLLVMFAQYFELKVKNV